ncbi:hypothetical protein F4861DRAFT_518186 [Xylaria intraflava]|nr:hypothetical protein F4861DRAFT_518186 [Xylaria intraflava]
MSLNAGARLVRVQPIRLHNRILPALFFSPDANQPYRNRTASTSTASQPKNLHPNPQTTTAHPDTLNPPASTRPPALDLPVRDANTGRLIHLFRLGRAYTTFYKTGLSAVLTNRRLLAASTTTSPHSRATLHLQARVRHDSARLPLFGLLALICGEFTPLIVLVFPQLTPYTCRIPAQTAVIRRGSEARRHASFRALAYRAGSADGHICRSLGLGSTLWDKAGYDVPFARGRADAAVRFLVRDDALLRSGGGVPLLVDEEVVIACEARGIDTLGKDTAWLRGRLQAWVAGTVAGSDAEAVEKTRALLLRG